ncbi:MAG: aminoacyl-tRNA hydrolase [Candidatus Omnitrophica bacterium]|nr:aminoacyl-tRNA hydrolase [Candidatus Omnitrophota bacterium]
MKVIIGLGNPGQTYQGTRHNIGFAVIQALADRHGVQLTHRAVSPRGGRSAGVFGDYEEAGRTVRLLMPLTMMNESGEALRTVEAAPQDLLIVCDDVNLPLGALRLRAEGGPGGHHGLVSCLEALGTEQVPRLRLGVGAPDMPSDLTDFVLSPFRSDERPRMGQMVAQAVDACEAWVAEGIAAAMNRYNKAQET